MANSLSGATAKAYGELPGSPMFYNPTQDLANYTNYQPTTAQFISGPYAGQNISTGAQPENQTLSTANIVQNANPYNATTEGDAARAQAKADLDASFLEYDRQAELGQQQIGALEQEQAGTLSDINTMRGRSATEAANAVRGAEESTIKEKGKALSSAQDVQRKNRNILRALGILSSSAAVEMLTKPMNEYQTQVGELSQALIKRKQQIDDWVMQKSQDFDSEVRKVQGQYSNLINNIRTDMRYNGEQRAQAVKAAGITLQQSLSTIQEKALQYQQAAREYAGNVLAQIAQLQLAQNPQADMSGITNSMISVAQKPYSSTAAMTLDDKKKKQSSGLLSWLE